MEEKKVETEVKKEPTPYQEVFFKEHRGIIIDITVTTIIVTVILVILFFSNNRKNQEVSDYLDYFHEMNTNLPSEYTMGRLDGGWFETLSPFGKERKYVQINSNNGGVEVIVREILVKDYSLKSVTESLMNRFWELSELPKETKVYAEWQIAYANQNENTGTPVFIVDPIEKRGSLRLMIIPLNVHGKMIEIVIKAHSSSDRNTVSEMVFNSMTFNKL